MMGRGLATAAIVLLLALDVALPWTGIGRRGTEPRMRSDVPVSTGHVGERLPDLGLRDLEGRPVSLASYQGRRVVLTFERSVDW